MGGLELIFFIIKLLMISLVLKGNIRIKYFFFVGVGEDFVRIFFISFFLFKWVCVWIEVKLKYIYDVIVVMLLILNNEIVVK